VSHGRNLAARLLSETTALATFVRQHRVVAEDATAIIMTTSITCWRWPNSSGAARQELQTRASKLPCARAQRLGRLRLQLLDQPAKLAVLDLARVVTLSRPSLDLDRQSGLGKPISLPGWHSPPVARDAVSASAMQRAWSMTSCSPKTNTNCQSLEWLAQTAVGGNR